MVIQFSNRAAIKEQTRLLGPRSTVSSVAGTWNSILTWWFPPDEEYQIRWNPTEEWIDLNVIRVAEHPDDTKVTTTPVFVARCYGGHPNAPQIGVLDTAMRQMTGSMVRTAATLKSEFLANYAAISSGNVVYLCDLDPNTTELHASADWPGAYCLSAFGSELREFLDNAKLQFAEEWGHPYSENCKYRFIELEDDEEFGEEEQEGEEEEEEEEEDDDEEEEAEEDEEDYAEESEAGMSFRERLYGQGPRMHGYMTGRPVVRASPEIDFFDRDFLAEVTDTDTEYSGTALKIKDTDRNPLSEATRRSLRRL
ncbi:hypothetical protein N7493_002859 [Penicillium malachiteum]|uniref:Uncharacterized protein n=1 Tax=Penicillium malachiteum TaxID=1324776 RepID=A0AAD6HT98_9EURO|nr:hypothetical protein N7493_002859 [Penicillium malachiteum]